MLSATAGQFILTGSITPYLDSGRLPRGLADVAEEAAGAKTGAMLIDVPTERALAQAWRVFERLKKLLEGHGATLDDVLRLRIFLRDRRDLTAVERVLAQLIKRPWPTTSVILMRAEGLDPQIDVQIDAIALAPAGPLRKEVVAWPDGGGREGYAPAVRAGQLLFANNVVGVNPATGELGTKIDEVKGNHEQIERFAYAEDHEQRILVQSWFIFEHLSGLLEGQGGTLDEVLKVNGWLDFSMRDYGPLIYAREHFFSRQRLPASTGLCVGGVVPDGAELTYDAIALVRGDQGYVKDQLAPSTIGTFYTDAVKAGPFILTCGEVPIDVSGPEVIVDLADLEDPLGRQLADGTIHVPTGTEARAWYIYRRIEDHLGHFGATLGDVVQQTVYLHRMDEFRAFERVSRLMFGDRPPPTTLVPITDTSPYPSAEMEIDVIAYADREGDHAT